MYVSVVSGYASVFGEGKKIQAIWSRSVSVLKGKGKTCH